MRSPGPLCDGPAGPGAGPRLPGSRPGPLERLGLHRPELRAWVMYDWANSAMVLVIITAVFPIYYSSVAAAELRPTEATFRYTVTTTLSLAVVAVLAPLLGAIADYAAIKKRLLGGFLALGVGAVALMFFVERGDWVLASVLFALANVGANGSFVFYDALLPHVARADEMDRVSAAGYALGYLGSGLLLALNLAWIRAPGWFGLPAGADRTPSQATLPVRLAFLSVAAWWLLFSMPLFRRVPEPPVALEPDEPGSGGAMRVALSRLGETFRALRGFRHAFLMLVAFFVYNDGIGTIIRLAAIYGRELGIDDTFLIASILLVQFIGIPFAFLFGALATRIGAKASIFVGLAVYATICVVGFFMRTATHFLVLAVLVGMVQGGTQALSRSLFASMIPRHKSGEFFGFFAVFEKFAGILGPAIFALTIAATGSSRNAILSVLGFFVVGALLLAGVDVAQGQRAARLADAEVRPAA
jgi:UMF1 family MFS transporter